MDLMSSTIHPYSIERARVGIQVGIYRSWSENCGFGGLPGCEVYGRRCRRILEFYGRAQTWELLGTKPDDALTRKLKYESFAGTTVGDIVVAGAIDPTIDGQVLYANSAAIYRSSICRIRGNTPNGGGALIWSDCPYWRATTIRDIAVETANKKDQPRSVAIRFAKPLTAKLDEIRSVWWDGWQGGVCHQGGSMSDSKRGKAARHRAAIRLLQGNRMSTNRLRELLEMQLVETMLVCSGEKVTK